MAHSFPTRRFSDLNRAGAGLRRPHGVLPDRTATRGTPARRPVRAPVVLFVRPVSDHAPADRRGPRPPSSGAPDTPGTAGAHPARPARRRRALAALAAEIGRALSGARVG